VSFGFFVAHDEDVGGLEVGEVADFAVHLFVAVVEFDAEAGGLEFGLDLTGVVVMALADGDEADLDGGEPEGECAGVVLDEDAEEALDGAKEGAVDHDGLMALAVFTDVFELEAGGEVEVELDGGKLPEAAEDVDEFEVDFGAVEGGFSLDGLEGNALAVEGALQGADGDEPVFVAAGVGLAIGRVPGGELDLELGEAEGAENGFGEVDAGDDFVFDLAGGAEDVGVVLGKAADAQQAVHGAGALVAVDVAEFGVADGQVAVRLGRVFVDEDVAGAVHGLEAVLGVVELHGGVHVAGIEALMTGDLPQFAAHDVGSVDEGVAAGDALVFHPVFHELADHGSAGMPEDEAGAGDFLNAEEVELLAEEAMVAAGGFFEASEVGVHLLLGEEGGAVDALELWIVFVAEPVSAGDAEHLDGADAAGGGDVGSAAEIEKISIAVEADLIAGVGEFGDEVGLHEVAVALEFSQGVFAEGVFAAELLVAGDDLGHFGLNGGEIVGGEGLFTEEVVEKASVGGGAVAELGLREELEDRGGHDVRGGVADDLERFRVGFLQQGELGVFSERGGEIDQARGGGVGFGVHLGVAGRLVFVRFRGGGVHRGEAGDDDGGGEARGDGVGDVVGRGAWRHFTDSAVGEMDGDGVFAHDGTMILSDPRPSDGERGSDTPEYTYRIRNKRLGAAVVTTVPTPIGFSGDVTMIVIKTRISLKIRLSLLAALALAVSLGVSCAQPPQEPTEAVTIVPAAAQPSDHFNADAATEAYLAKIPAAAKARSDAYFEGGYWLVLWDFLYASAVAFLLLNLRWSAWMRDLAARVCRWVWLQPAVYWLQYAVVTAVLGFPLEFYENYIREHKYGMATQTFGPWMGDEGKGLLVSMVLGFVATPVLFLIVRKLPRTWWIWGAFTTVAFMVVLVMIGPVYLQPIFNKVTRLDDPKVTVPILSMAHANGIPTNDVYEIDASRQTTRMSANVSGFAGTMRITLNDNLLRRGSREEIQAVMGHEMGHYVLHHIAKDTLFFFLVIVGSFAYLRWALAWTLAKWGERWGIRGVADPAVLPLVFLLTGILFFVLTPILNTHTRTAEGEADMFGLNASRQPDGFAQAAIHLGEYRKMRPGPVEEWIFFDHPSGYNRIHAAMVWKGENLELFRDAAPTAASH